MTEQDLVSLMTEKARAVQTVVERCPDWAAVVRYTLDLTAAQGGSTVAPWGLPEEVRRKLAHGASEKGLRLLDPPFGAHLEEIHTAITPADWGIAETGTVVLDSTAEDLRLATMLSETHVVVLPQGRLRLTSFDVAEALKARHREPPCYVAFISGASRTADIERVLTIGVHGPQDLHLLILQEGAS